MTVVWLDRSLLNLFLNVCRSIHQDKYKQSGFDCSAGVLILVVLASHFTLETEYSKLIDDLISHLKTFVWHFYPTDQTVSIPYGVELLRVQWLQTIKNVGEQNPAWANWSWRMYPRYSTPWKCVLCHYIYIRWNLWKKFEFIGKYKNNYGE